MILTTAPLNGPSASFNFSQDRLALSHHISAVQTQINDLPFVLAPDASTIEQPQLPSSLALGLAGGNVVLQDRPVAVGALSLVLPAYATTYLDIVPTGRGEQADFALSDLVYQPAGTFAGSYEAIPGTLKAAASLDLSNGDRLWQAYSGQFAAQAGGWGPGLLDAQGNGYVIRVTASGGGLFRAVNGVASGGALALLSATAASTGGSHSFMLGTRWLNGTLELQLKIDSASTILLDYTDTAPTVSPAALFPAFICDGGSVYLNSWQWYTESGAPAAGWRASTVAIGAPAPLLARGGLRFYAVTTAAAPLLLQPLFIVKQFNNQLAQLRQTLTQLQAAYF